MLEDASRQVSTGKKLVQLGDSPSGSAEMVGLRDELSQIDQYRTNSDYGTFLIGIADSVLGSVHDLVTSIFSKGSEAASGTLDSQGRAGIAREVRSIRDQILSMANTEARGRYLFAGSRVSAPAFAMSGDIATYQGDSVTNTIGIADGLDVQTGLIGSDVFSPVFQTIGALLIALDNNDVSAIQAALTQFAPTLSGVSQFRGKLGIDLGRLQGIASEQDTREESIRERQSSLENVNMAEALTRLNQLQTALNATLTTRATVQPKNLFDYLG